MKEWKQTTLNEVAAIQTGPFGSQLHERDYVQNGTPIITVEHLVNDRIQHSKDVPKVSDTDKQRLKKYILKEGDIVFSRVGSVDRSAYVSNKENGWMFSGRLLRVRPHESKISAGYLHHWLTQKKIKAFVGKIAVGATMPSLNTALLGEIPVEFPPMPEQKAIAAVLSCLDDKIELLRQQNQTLEKIAQTLFKHWFVDFEFPNKNGQPYKSSGGKMVDSEMGEIPEGWKTGVLREHIEIIGGGTPKTSITEYWDGDILWFSVVDAPETSDVFVIDTEKKITKAGLNNSSTRLLPKGTTIISARGTVGRFALVAEPMTMNQSCYGIKGIHDFTDYFTYLLLRNAVAELQRNTHGSVFDTITRDTFKSINIAIPNPQAIELFEQTVTPLFNRILFNRHESQTLTTIRDRLLPKLMSGEVRVKI